MPIYFTDIAPHCPVSRDQPVGPMITPTIRIRTTIPRAHDLASAIAAVNILRTIISQIVRDRVVNNVYSKTPLQPYPPVPGGVFDRRRTSRWVEQKKLRVKQKYKYYGFDGDGKSSKEVYAITERIEKMVWYDKAWKTYLVWEYGDKGQGEPV